MGGAVTSSRYCVRCGRPENPEEPLINGYCSDCYIDHVGLFDAQPVLSVTICSRCGSWYYKGRWWEPLSFEDIIRRLFLDWAEKHLTDGVELVEVEHVGKPVSRGHGWYDVVLSLSIVLVNNAVRRRDIDVRFKLTKTVCPRCLKKAGKSFNSLVQFRSTRGYLTEEEKSYIREKLSAHGIAEEVVEIIENRQGIDVKMSDHTVARRLAGIVSRERSAHVKETFKLRRYDPGRGRKEGVITLSVRLHDIAPGMVMEYEGRPCVVIGVRRGRVLVEFLDNGETAEFSIDLFWRGLLRRNEKLVRGGEYTVVGYDSSMLYLVNDETGEIVEYPRLVNLNTVKVGDKFVSYRVADKTYMVRKRGGGDG